MSDRYHWCAHYADGSSLPEYDADCPDGRGFREVDLPRCVAFELIPQQAGLTGVTVACNLAEGLRPIFFRRRTVGINTETGEGTPDGTVHVIGWQRTVNGVNVASYTYLFHDGSALIADHDSAV